MAAIRRPAVAGSFYPSEPHQLRAMVRGFVDEVRYDGRPPKAIIAPHAGYIYSGPVAASAYARLKSARGRIRRVVLIGPSHRVPFRGLAVTDAHGYHTPLGDIAIDQNAVKALRALPQVSVLNAAHAPEHSLEVHLPFLQEVLGAFKLVPIVAGSAAPEEVAEALEAVWDGDETLIVVSSDLSHYLDYDSARIVDRRTTEAIERLGFDAVGPQQACGCVPISGLLAVARRRGMSIETLDVRNSGDTAGPRDGVVGYGAWALSEPPLG